MNQDKDSRIQSLESSPLQQLMWRSDLAIYKRYRRSNFRVVPLDDLIELRLFQPVHNRIHELPTVPEP
jgi:hypothetical protein